MIAYLMLHADAAEERWQESPDQGLASTLRSANHEFSSRHERVLIKWS